MREGIEFDVALSFAGENRGYVEHVAESLKEKGIRVFYDNFEQVNLWGKNLYDYFQDVYRNKAYFIVMFISKYYVEKAWTNVERQGMMSRAIDPKAEEYILPARFDDTEVPGLFSTIGYISLKGMSPENFSDLIAQKLRSKGVISSIKPVRPSGPKEAVIQKSSLSKIVIIVMRDNKELLSNAQVFLVADNDTYFQAETDVNGSAVFEVAPKREYSLFVAHPETASFTLERVIPGDRIDNILLSSSEKKGSIIIAGTGYIPGLAGRLNPILDSQHRTYLYADNIAINGGEPQPGYFTINLPLSLEDKYGVSMQLVFKCIRGVVSLIEYMEIG